MNTLRIWAIGVASACAVGGIISLIVPKNSNWKVMKIIVSVFLIASFIAPFAGSEAISFDFSGDFLENSEMTFDDYNRILTEQQISAAEDEVESKITELLKVNKIKCNSINVCMNTDENNSINIKEIKIKVEKKNEITKTVRLIQKEFRLNAEVVSDEME